MVLATAAIGKAAAGLATSENVYLEATRDVWRTV
jgi:hypothetical protein